MTDPRAKFRQEYLNEWAGPKQCEAHAPHSTVRCPHAAEYALIVGDLTGYVCGDCLGSQVRANAKQRPVTVENCAGARSTALI